MIIETELKIAFGFYSEVKNSKYYKKQKIYFKILDEQ